VVPARSRSLSGCFVGRQLAKCDARSSFRTAANLRYFFLHVNSKQSPYWSVVSSWSEVHHVETGCLRETILITEILRMQLVQRYVSATSSRVPLRGHRRVRASADKLIRSRSLCTNLAHVCLAEDHNGSWIHCPAIFGALCCGTKPLHNGPMNKRMLVCSRRCHSDKVFVGDTQWTVVDVITTIQESFKASNINPSSRITFLYQHQACATHDGN